MAEVNMDIEPNSHSYKEKKKEEKLTPVVQKGSLVSSKKPIGQRAAEAFSCSDTNELKKYVWQDLMLPGIKNLVLSTLRMWFFKDDRDSGDYYGYGGGSYGGHYNYSGRYRSTSGNTNNSRNNDYRSNSEKDYRNIVLNSRADAEEVAGRLQDRIEAQGYTTVADLFDLVGLSSKYTDNNWGWDRVDDIRVRRIAKGFLIDVREAIYVGDR